MPLHKETSDLVRSSQTDAEPNIVIIGAGIAGLATALAFHRLGIQTLVLEQSDTLRPGGTSIGLWKNAWHALDALGVSDELRKNYSKVSCFEVLTEAGKLIQRISFNNVSHELRAVERTALLEALAKPLPKGTIRFNSKVTKISKGNKRSQTEIYLDDGTTITSKVLIGCDGVHSAVAQWMGLKEPGFVGQYAIRGVAKYTADHEFGTVSRQYLGTVLVAELFPYLLIKPTGFVPLTTLSKVPPSPLSGWVTDPERVKEEAKILIKNWSNESKEIMYGLIDNSPPETISRSALRDRLALPFFTPELAIDGVTLAGDALHPVTPNLGQGGCLALEDGVILAREIYTALTTQEEFSQVLSDALETYINQRWKRFLPLTIQSRIMGAVMTLNSALLCYFRDNFGLQVLLRVFGYSNHTQFDCGALPMP